jgi:GNAT superfamily N-acetyltransferase
VENNLEWRGDFLDDELNALLRAAWGSDRQPELDVAARLAEHSLGWVTARTAKGSMSGFINVAWDGGLHAFLLDTTVLPAYRRIGLGTRLVKVATDEALRFGCEHVHVDFDSSLADFYLGACGFRSTPAGLQSAN